MNAFVDVHELAVAERLSEMLFLGYVMSALLAFIFASSRVTLNTVFASLCIYLLLGLAWALAYSVVDWFDPEAFTWTVSPGRRRRQ